MVPRHQQTKTLPDGGEKESMMKKREEKFRLRTFRRAGWKLLLWKDTRGQDLVEYALLAGFVAVAAGALLPGISTSISTIFSKMGSVLTAAAS